MNKIIIFYIFGLLFFSCNLFPFQYSKSAFCQNLKEKPLKPNTKAYVFTEKEMLQYYEKHKEKYTKEGNARICLNEIVVKVPPNADNTEEEKALAKIRQLKNKIEDGETFENIAEKYSESRSAKDRGWIGCKNHSWLGDKKKIVYTLKTGQISDILYYPYGGYCILKVVDHIPGHDITFEDAKERIRTELRIMKQREIAKSKAVAAKSQAKNFTIPQKIEINVDYKPITPINPFINKCSIVLDNKSGSRVFVKIIGQTKSEVDLENNSVTYRYVDDGKYYIKIRYGENQKNYKYEKGNIFELKTNGNKLTIYTIIIQKVVGGTYGVTPINKSIFYKD
jgi:hypothetical protein